MLKPRIEIESLPEDDEDIYYLKTKFESYLQRPTQLAPLYIQSFINGGAQQLQLNKIKAVSMSACSIHNMVMVANST